MSDSSNVRLGIDLGGTKIEAVLLEVTGVGSFRELARHRAPTEQQLGYEAIVSKCGDLIRHMKSRAGLNDVPIGIGMPGSVRRRDGAVKNSNTTCLNGRSFRQDLVDAVGAPIAFDNDANCFALAETHFGAASEYREGVVFGVIIGTGVGGGVVVNGRVWSGRMGIGGEWGHHTVFAAPDGQQDRLRPCYCGKRGCVEVYVSGPALEADYAQRARTNRPVAEIFRRRQSDSAAAAAIDVFLEAFSRGLANVIDVLDPTAIVLGGGLSNLDALYTEGVERMAGLVFNDELTTPVLRPKLGDSAGVIGAALLPDPR